METLNTSCKITIIGANGGIGQQAVEIVLKAGHSVTAIVRNPAGISVRHERLTIVQGDVMKPDTLVQHLENSDAIISAIGKNSFKKTQLYSQGSRHLLDAMEKAGCRRVFFISASGLDVNPTHSLPVRLATRFILQQLLRNMYADLRRMEKVIKQSDADWTIMRPPRLTNDGLTGRYRVAINALLPNGLSISRADVAHYIINAIGDHNTFKKTVEVAY